MPDILAGAAQGDTNAAAGAGAAVAQAVLNGAGAGQGGDANKGAAEQAFDYSALKIGEEGASVDTVMFDEFKTLAKGANIKKEDAQKFIDLGTKLLSMNAKAQTSQMEAISDGWRKEIENDPEFGGIHLNDTAAAAQRVLGKFGDKQLVDDLEKAKFGNHPGIIRMLARIDKAYREDKMIEGKPTTPRADVADVLFTKSGG